MLSRLVDNGTSPIFNISSQKASQPFCMLLWRRGKLWVGLNHKQQEFALPALASEQWFHTCLVKSKVDVVAIDPDLGTEVIWHWAQACFCTNKFLHLRHPSCHSRPSLQKSGAWRCKRIFDYMGAVVLLVGLSPMFLIIAGLIQLQDGGPVLCTHWRVGKRGKLFQALHFRTTSIADYTQPNSLGIRQRRHILSRTGLGLWLWQTHLDKLPLLVNVLRGEMSLVGPHAWALHEAVQLPVELRERFSLLPGITGTWWTYPLTNRSNFDKIVEQELKTICNWSLAQDFVTLLRTVIAVVASPLLGRPSIIQISPKVFFTSH